MLAQLLIIGIDETEQGAGYVDHPRGVDSEAVRALLGGLFVVIVVNIVVGVVEEGYCPEDFAPEVAAFEGPEDVADVGAVECALVLGDWVRYRGS